MTNMCMIKNVNSKSDSNRANTKDVNSKAYQSIHRKTLQLSN